jgi:flagellar biosynthesis/type III secretory pathway M-ring protein FliF/YscJ
VLLIVLAVIPPLVTRPMIAGHVTFAQTFDGAASGLEPERRSLTTEDGLALAAFAVHVDAPKAVILFLSGTHNPSVTAFFGHAAWLAGHGYASLLVEMTELVKSRPEDAIRVIRTWLHQQ